VDTALLAYTYLVEVTYTQEFTTYWIWS